VQLPAFSTPLAGRPPSSRRQQRISDVIDDSSPQRTPEGVPEDEEQATVPHDSIELDDVVSQSPPAGTIAHEIDTDEDVYGGGGSSSPDQPLPKRRRISLSLGLEITSSQPDGDLLSPSLRQDDDDDTAISLEDEPSRDDEMSMSLSSSAGEDDDVDVGRATAGAQQKPTFRAPPRFKAPEPATQPVYQLPEAFSPHQHRRRGAASYVAGGLAAEVRDWLVQLKRSDDAPDDGFIARVAVDEARAAAGFVLVCGRVVVPEGDGEPLRAILVGEGRLSGLGLRTRVEAGCVVGVAQPTWEVVLEGETWAVACDWVVL